MNLDSKKIDKLKHFITSHYVPQDKYLESDPDHNCNGNFDRGSRNGEAYLLERIAKIIGVEIIREPQEE